MSVPARLSSARSLRAHARRQPGGGAAPDLSTVGQVASPAERATWLARDRELRLLRRADPQAGLAAAGRWLAEAPLGSEAGAWALRAYAHGQSEVGALGEALACYERAEHLFDRLGLPLEVARTAAGHVWTLRMLGRYEEAVRLALRARRFLGVQGETLEAAKLTLNLGTVYDEMGRLEAALRAFMEATRHYRRCGDATGEATAVSNVGEVLAHLGRYEEAELSERRAIRLYSQLGQVSELARARLYLGLLLKRRGDFGRAITTLQDSRALYDRLGLARGLAEADLYLAQTYLSLNLQREAAEASQRARIGFEQLHMPSELGQALLWSAAVAERRGESAEAARRLAESADLFKRTGKRLWEAVATILEASLAEADEVTLDRVAAAERRLARLGARDRAIEARLVQGDLYRRLGRDQQALVCYRAAARAVRGLGDEHLEYRISAALGQMLEAFSPGRALGHYRAAMEHLEALRRRARADDLKLSFVSDKLDVYERTVGLLLGRSRGYRRAAEALAVIERGKSLGLLDDLLAQADRGGRETAALARRLRDLRARLSEAYARGDEASGLRSPTEQADLARLEQDVAAATRELQLAIRGDATAAPFDLERLQSALPADAVLLEYYSLGPELVCFIVDAQRVRLRRGLGSLVEVSHLADRLRFHLGKGIFGSAYLEANLDRLRQGLDRVLGELWRQLVAPLWSEVQTAGQVIVVPHGPLHGLPLHAAFDGRTYLAERSAVSYAPSARVFTACAERQSDPPRRPLFVGPRDERLPWVAREVTALAKLFPHGEELAGRRATLAGVRRRSGHFDLLHLAAHGLFRADNPNFSALRLADGWLSVADLAELSRGATLVTLSACETGLSSVAAGEELVGLTRAVLGAGTASLLASLWTVHDEATSRFMAEFYKGLRSGRGKTASLQSAMWAVRRELDHPYFWAPFALAGAV
jgi:tetratricopeptide (TPR) repeat protein